MTNEPLVLITAEDFKAKQDEAARLERQIAEDQKKLGDIRDWLKVVASLAPQGRPMAGADTVGPAESQQVLTFRSATAVDGDNLTLAIEKLANTSPVAVPKAQLKKALLDQGFSPERLANYFYTAIHRLKAKDRISVLSDGSVWKKVAP